jgi:hypothetical protein
MTRKACKESMTKRSIFMALIAVQMAGRMHGEAARMDQPEPDWSKAPCNQTIIQLIGRMPSGGGYATGKVALGNLAGAVAIGSNGVKV